MTRPMIMRPPTAPLNFIAPTTQDIAVVMCGAEGAFQEWEQLKAMCIDAGKKMSIFAGNDMIEHFPEDIDHALSLHPDKFRLWLPRRSANGFNRPGKIWAHRNYEGCVTHWTRDWSGSTGLFCVKVARECGFTHIVLCGVHMMVESGHFVRKQEWGSALAFRRGWLAHKHELKPYVRSMGGWTRDNFTEPTKEWLQAEIKDFNQRSPDPEDLKA